MKPKVVAQFPLHPDAVKILTDVADLKMGPFPSREAFMAEMRDADALIGAVMVDEQFLHHASKLKVNACFGVGYQDRTDVEACSRHGVYVTYTPGVLSAAVADLTMGLILCLARGILSADRYVRTSWAAGGHGLPLGLDLEDRTLGILGLGRIGSEVAKRAKAFGMSIIYYDTVRNWKAEEEGLARYVGLQELLASSDFVTVHVPLTTETAKLIGERELRAMKRTAYLINTSRGGVVDEEALCKALAEGWIAGAGLDVFAKEPLPLNSPLVKMENVVLTPHIGSAAQETRRRMALMNATDVVRVLRGEEPLNLIPEQRKSPPVRVSRL
ncbi:MAG: D-glycerate dehydrogenase [Candidatus Bathyarchaeia archaeon]